MTNQNYNELARQANKKSRKISELTRKKDALIFQHQKDLEKLENTHQKELKTLDEKISKYEDELKSIFSSNQSTSPCGEVFLSDGTSNLSVSEN